MRQEARGKRQKSKVKKIRELRMSEIKDFKDLIIWQIRHGYCPKVLLYH
jgi:hypothetical protein